MGLLLKVFKSRYFRGLLSGLSYSAKPALLNVYLLCLCEDFIVLPHVLSNILGKHNVYIIKVRSARLFSGTWKDFIAVLNTEGN